MKYLIVGLGNPGAKYAETRHNIGFKVVEKLAADHEVPFDIGRLGELAQVKHKGRTLLLLKPNTFMNLSGKAVNFWMQAQKIPIERVLVVTDDLALPFGKLRLKGKGSAGGHNGLKDIIAVTKTDQFARLRFGVGDNFSRGKQVDYVLGEWNDDEKMTLDERIEMSTEFIKSFVTIGLDKTMSEFNNK
jgi:PTH1 family peptidyl-tRNA hydrolase